MDEADAEELGPVEVGPHEIRLVAYEALAGGALPCPRHPLPRRRGFSAERAPEPWVATRAQVVAQV